jgi:hypothetical protein
MYLICFLSRDEIPSFVYINLHVFRLQGRKPEPLERVGVDGRIILKLILKEHETG